MKHIAVLLTVFNRKKQTLQCLENLFKQEIPGGYCIEVYLTNDGCTDGTPEAIREQFPQVHIIDGDGTLFWNRGMCTAWNAAANAKDYDYYLWLNDDTFLHEGAILTLLEVSDKEENKTIVVGATNDKKIKELTTYGGIIGESIVPCDGKLHEVEYFNGNIVLIPSSVYQVLGNLDYYYTHSKGDFDYGVRAKKAGVKMIQVGEALGTCDRHQRIDKWCNPEIPLRKRWQLMKHPNGMPPNEIFHLEKQISLPMAIFHYLTIYLRCLFPWVWIISGKAKI